MPLAAMGGIGLGQALVGGIFGSKASNAQVNALQQALGLQRQMYNQTRADAMPWMQNGQNATNTLAYLMGLGDPNQPHLGASGGFGSLAHNFGTADFQADPGYQFRLSEGQKALERSAAARGTSFSGGTLKALDQYNQGFASNEYQNAYNRFQQNRNTTYGFLNGISGQGLQAEGNIAQAGMNYANQGSQIYGNIGAAQAMGDASWANAINGGLNTLGQGYMLSQLMKPKPGQSWFNSGPGYNTSAYPGGPNYTGGGGIGGDAMNPGWNYWQNLGTSAYGGR